MTSCFNSRQQTKAGNRLRLARIGVNTIGVNTIDAHAALSNLRGATVAPPASSCLTNGEIPAANEANPVSKTETANAVTLPGQVGIQDRVAPS